MRIGYRRRSKTSFLAAVFALASFFSDSCLWKAFRARNEPKEVEVLLLRIVLGRLELRSGGFSKTGESGVMGGGKFRESETACERGSTAEDDAFGDRTGGDFDGGDAGQAGRRCRQARRGRGGNRDDNRRFARVAAASGKAKAGMEKGDDSRAVSFRGQLATTVVLRVRDDPKLLRFGGAVEQTLGDLKADVGVFFALNHQPRTRRKPAGGGARRRGSGSPNGDRF